MKKIYFVFVCLLASVASFAIEVSGSEDVGHQIDLNYHLYPHHITPSGKRPRTPAYRPRVYIQAHTLYLEEAGLFETIKLVDSISDEVVYEVSISTEMQVNLPEDLRGDFEIHLCREFYYFSGMIEL